MATRSLEAPCLSTFLGAVYAPRTPERLNHSKRQVTCFGTSMDRAQAILNSRRAQILFDALLVQKDTNVTITDMWGRIVMGPEICDSYLELMSWWGVRFGFGYGDLGVGGPSRGVGHRMEKERDFRVVALNQLLGCCTGPPIAAVFHAFFLPAAGVHRQSGCLAQRALDGWTLAPSCSIRVYGNYLATWATECMGSGLSSAQI